MIRKLLKFLEKLEKLERYFPQVFWPVVCSLGLVFNFHDSNEHEQFHSPEPNTIYIAQNVSWRDWKISSPRDDFTPPFPGTPPDPPPGPGDRGTNSKDYDPKPRFPWGVNPNAPVFGSAGSGDPIADNQVPDSRNWKEDGWKTDSDDLRDEKSEDKKSEDEKLEDDQGLKRLESRVDLSVLSAFGMHSTATIHTQSEGDGIENFTAIPFLAKLL